MRGQFAVFLNIFFVFFCFCQWSDYLSKDLPQEYLDELSGLDAGGIAIGVADVGLMSSRGITLANLPGDVEDIVFVLIDEFQTKAKLTKQQKMSIPAMKKVFAQVFL